MRAVKQGFAFLLVVFFSVNAWGESRQESASYQILTMDQLEERATDFFDKLQAELAATDTNDFMPVWLSDSQEYAALTNSLVVQLEQGIDPRIFESAFEVTLKRLEGLEQTYVLSFDSVDAAMSAYGILQEADGVSYIQNDFQLHLKSRSIAAEPKDIFFKDQWHLKNTGQLGPEHKIDIQILEAWKTTTGNRTKPIVAVVDGGFDIEHPDLKEKWFANSNEIPDNQKDDDDNGLEDDYYGWNFATGSNKMNFGFGAGHGTAVAGLVGAAQNKIGTVGTCPDCRILPITINGRVSKDAKAFLYAIERGAQIITNSWGYSIGSLRTKVVEEAIAKAAKEGRDGKGAIIFFAMNNAHVDDCEGSRPDISSHPDVIAVSSIDGTGTRVRKSGYGECLKFLSTSGQNSKKDGVVTTDVVGSSGYNYKEDDETELSDWDYTKKFGGTSAATPILAGGAALLLDIKPELTKDELVKLFATTARKVEAEKAGYDEETGHSDSHGFGLVSIDAALKSLLKSL